MLTKEENAFLEYWKKERVRKRSPFSFSMGLVMAAIIALALFLNIVSGWNEQASAVLRSNSSLILVIVIASIGISVFLMIFTRRYRFEQQEQRYQELLMKEKKHTAS
jgi:ABC-type dipeptide/oligopeptide/nickel transport system permease component